MNIKEKLLKRMAGEEQEKQGIVIEQCDSVSVTLQELSLLNLSGKQGDWLDSVVKKNGGDLSRSVIMDKADLTGLMEGCEVVREVNDQGVVCKRALKASPPAKDEKKSK